MQVNFLSQVRFSRKGDGPIVAKRLIDVYFALFKVWLHSCFETVSFIVHGFPIMFGLSLHVLHRVSSLLL